MNLNQAAPKRLRRMAGWTLITVLLGASAYSAWATQAPEVKPAAANAKAFETSMTITDSATTIKAKVRTREGDITDLRDGTDPLSYSFSLVEAKPDSVTVNLIVRQGDKVIAEPKLRVGYGEEGTIQKGGSDEHDKDFLIKLVVSPVKPA